MIEAILTIGGIGFVASLGLAVASRVFYVYVDPQILAVEEALPGANCGGCGFPGCSGAAEAIATGKQPPNICVGGGPDVQTRIAEILGVEIKETEPEIARPGCYYGVQDADLKYLYNGYNDCRAAMMLSGGAKTCPVGCLGLGTCARACPFDAITMGDENLPVVDPELCTGCGTCERVCPKNIITLSNTSTRMTEEYTTEVCTAPCQRTCPAGIDIPSYIYHVGKGEYDDAVRVIKEKNPLPLVCGRICVHPCEFECRRNLVDEPVAINYIKRFAADHEMNSGTRIQLKKAPATGKKVAVVGGGAEGLTTADFLARLGHEPTVYEASPKLGGLLQTVIPDSRLPKDVLDWEIQGILETGVNAVTSMKLGRDITVDALLKEGYDAVFVATGGWDAQLSGGRLTEPGEVLPGVQLLMHFTLSQLSDSKPQVGEKVMILGGGNASLDAAEMCLQSGASEVHVLFRGRRNDALFSEQELKAAESKGIRFHFNSALIRMSGEETHLTHVQIAEVEVRDPEKGKAVIKDGTLQELPMDTLLVGAGRFPELIYAVSKPEGEEAEAASGGPVRWETVAPYAGPFATEDIGIFRPGEAKTDYKAVIEAIGAGRRAASSIHKFLTGEPVEAPENMIRRNTRVISVDDLEPVSSAPREKMPEISREDQLEHPDAEVELGLTEDQALQEAKRCLRCGLICYRRVEQEEQELKSA
jgi:NADPH-dependent glutamate synthase beta subunit-like oxidoreductase